MKRGKHSLCQGVFIRVPLSGSLCQCIFVRGNNFENKLCERRPPMDAVGDRMEVADSDEDTRAIQGV